MWRVVLYLTPVTVGIALALTFLGALGLRSAATRWPQAVCRIGSLGLALWLLLIAAATLTGDGSGGGGGGHGGSLWFSPGFDTLRADSSYADSSEKEMVVRQWVANALMFVPLPVLLAAARRDFSAIKCLGLCTATTVAIELMQWLEHKGRVVDLDDVVFNSVGATVGVVLSVSAGLLLRWLPGHRADAEERV